MSAIDRSSCGVMMDDSRAADEGADTSCGGYHVILAVFRREGKGNGRREVP
jgi:hypothetical protein